MELPKIIESILPQKKPLNDRILALIITPYHIKCALIETSKVNILGQGEEEYEGSWENAIPAADMSIAKATNGIENANQIKKVIFSLPHNWVVEDKIEPEYLQNLKKLSQDLDLSPLGFVVTPEAIIHYMQKIEGSPLTAILVGFSKDKIYVTLIHAGKKEEIKEKTVSENIVEDFKALLSEFPSMEIFPSRILLYNHREDLEKVKQELLSYSWQKYPGFLHFPKVEILEKDIDLKSAVLAGVTELGIVVEPKPKATKEEKEDFFVEGKDVLEGKLQEEIPTPSEIKIYEPQKEESKTVEKPLSPPQIESKFIESLKSKITIKTQFLKISLIIAPFLLFILGGVLTAFYYYFPKAKVTLVIESRLLEKNINVGIASDIKEVDEENKKIPSSSVETEVSGQKATTATGKKTVGDKAKGEVTVYNKTSSLKTFSKETEIVGPKNLKFALDDDISIASASSGIEGVTFGKAKVKISASQIGTDSNLNSGSEFSFKDFPTSSYSARNEQNFIGGTSREITVITKEDQTRLKDILAKELEEKAKQSLKEKLTQGEVILDKGMSTTTTSTKFDKEIDSEAKDTNLNLTIKVKALFYKDSDLKNIARRVLDKDIPDGYELKAEDINITVDKVTASKDESVAAVIIKANLLPKIDTKKIQKDIAGKYPEVLDSYFRGLPSLAGYEIKITPNLPKKFATTPRIPENITINIIAR